MSSEPGLWKVTNSTYLFFNVNCNAESSSLKLGDIVLYLGDFGDHDGLFLFNGIVHVDVRALRLGVALHEL